MPGMADRRAGVGCSVRFPLAMLAGLGAFAVWSVYGGVVFALIGDLDPLLAPASVHEVAGGLVAGFAAAAIDLRARTAVALPLGIAAGYAAKAVAMGEWSSAFCWLGCTRTTEDFVLQSLGDTFAAWPFALFTWLAIALSPAGFLVLRASRRTPSPAAIS